MVPVDINRLVKESTENSNFLARMSNSLFPWTRRPHLLVPMTYGKQSLITCLVISFGMPRQKLKLQRRKKKSFFYNDGPNIEEDLKEGIFIPFRKGNERRVWTWSIDYQKTVDLMGYTIETEI